MKNNFVFKLIKLSIIGLGIPVSVFIVSRFSVEQNISVKAAAADFPTSTKVLVLDFNPTLPSRGDVTLREYRNWNRPSDLESRFIEDIGIASHNFVNYQIIDRITIDDFPLKADGFDYNDQSYLACLENSQNCHQPDGVDYLKILRDYNVCSRRNQGEIDELWLWGGPYFGYWEAVMAGPGGFWTNAPAIEIPECQKKLNIMGFNYEREIPEMLEDFIHRAEGTMTHIFGSWEPELTHDWNRFSVLDKDLPDSAGCGNAHWGHNSIVEYQMNITSPKNSSCLDWINYPYLSNIFQSFGCTAWECQPGNNRNTGYNFKKWWLNYFPAGSGHNNFTLNNWFKYILDFDAAVAEYSCAGHPNIYLLSPADGFNVGGNTQDVSLSAHADFNTCTGSRFRSIWIKDENTQQSFSQLCYYSNDQGNTDFNCRMSGLQTGHRYSWYALAQNESFFEQSDIWQFDVGTVIPTPAPACALTASPNPCAIAEGQTVCSTSIGWSANTGIDIYAGSTLFASPANYGAGSKIAPWIGTSDITFGCYKAGTNSPVLAAVTVHGERYMYYCRTNTYTCSQTAQRYRDAAACQANLDEFLPGQTTGICYIDAAVCSANCTAAAPTPTPTPTPTPPINADPIIITEALPDGAVSSRYQAEITGFDADAGFGATITMSATGLPPGLKLSRNCQNTREKRGLRSVCPVSGVPLRTGIFPIVISVEDNRGGRSEKTLTLKIN